MVLFNLKPSVLQLYQVTYQIHYIKKENIVKNEIIGAGAAGGLAIGGTMDSATGFSDGGLLTGMGADIGKKVSTGSPNRITPDTNTPPDRMKYFGDPISMFDFNATTIMPSFKQRWDNSAHTNSGLFKKRMLCPYTMSSEIH